jgi:hypothetical protein
MASDTEIANRALQKLGAKRITSLTQDHKNARSMNVAFIPVREAILRAHPWAFAIKRAQLAASATAPDFGPAQAFPLPSDFLRLLHPDLETNYNNLDWKIEGREILTEDSAPLDIRYIYRVEDPNTMDPIFRELFSSTLALELCEEITQSNTKKDFLKRELKDILSEARRTNAIEKIRSDEPPEDTWLTVRT